MISGRIGFMSSGTHPEATAWAARVVTAGGTVSDATLAAVSTFCLSVDSAGLRGSLYRVNLFCGTGLAACLVPLYRGPSSSGTQFGNATDTNNNFATSDYSEATGLQGNGSNKSLDTGLAQNFASDRHIGFVPRTLGTTAFRYYMGARSSGFVSLYAAYASSPTSIIGYYNYSDVTSAGGGPNTTATLRRLYVAVSSPPTSGQAYSNGTSGGSSVPAWATTNTVTLAVFAMKQADGTFNAPANPLLSGYTIGTSLTAARVATYNTIWTALLTALGRQ